MAKLIPKEQMLTDWRRLESNRDYAVRVGASDTVMLRPGEKFGAYLTLERHLTQKTEVMANLVDYESGEGNPVGRIAENQRAVIGRTSECSLRVMHGLVSREHLYLWLDGVVLFIRDLGSRNGSFLLSNSNGFDVETYLAEHPMDTAHERTLDPVHEAFGEGLDQALRNYIQRKEQNP